MSIALLKNLFLYKRATPPPQRTKSQDSGTFVNDSSARSSSRKPLLRHDSSEFRLSEDSERGLSSGDDTIVDLESQGGCKVINRKQENQEKKSRINPAIIRDATVGLSDGLTVPFALTAGLSALGSTKVVIYGGFAELIAGAISMGLGGYLGAKSEAASYKALREDTERQVATNLPAVKEELLAVFEEFGWPEDSMDYLESTIPRMDRLVDFTIRFQHCEKFPESTRPLVAGVTIAVGYLGGGIMPLLPYLFVGPHEISKALEMSIAVMVVALFMFGYAKTSAVTGSWFKGSSIREGCKEGLQMILVGSIAAAAAMGSVKLFSHDESSIGGNVHA